MPLNEAADVRNILGGTSLTDGEIAAFLEEAAAYLASRSALAALSEGVRVRLEARMAAWFIGSREARHTSVQHADVKETFQRDAKVSEHLSIAAGLDPTGTIRADFLNQERSYKAIGVVGAGYADA